MQRPWLALILCAAVGWAAERAVPPHRSAAHKRASDAATSTRSDREIEADIRARFARSKINQDHFQVHVQGGVATLEGATDVLQHKGTATRLAKTGGARQVVNRIEVSQAARERAAANLAKGRRRAQLKRSEARSERSAR
jgi:osmotically-inducible protein OsmY